jgi:hypothetical protein
MGMHARAGAKVGKGYVSMDYRLALGSSSAVRKFDQLWIEDE